MIGSAATLTLILGSAPRTDCMTWRTTAESSTTRTWMVPSGRFDLRGRLKFTGCAQVQNGLAAIALVVSAFAGNEAVKPARAWIVGAIVFKFGAITPRCSEWPTTSSPHGER